MTAAARRRFIPWLLALGAYGTLTLIATWPLASRVSSVLPHDLGDPVLGTWILWWNAHRLPLTADYWNAPMFWPMPGALALGEHLLGISLVATPLQWLGATPVVAFNVVFLLSFPLCALAAHLLAHTLTGRHEAAMIAGLLFAFNPYRISQLAHLQLLWAFWMPLALVSLHRYARGGRSRWLALFGIAWVVQGLSNGYYLLFFPVLLLAWLAWFLGSRRDMPRLLTVFATWTLASTALLPVLVAYLRVHSHLGAERTLEVIRGFSADVGAFATTSPLSLAWSRLAVADRSEQQLFPGITAVALIVGVGGWSMRRTSAPPAQWPRMRRAVAAFACFFMLAALGTAVWGPSRVDIAGRTLVSITKISRPITLAIWCAVVLAATNGRVRRAWSERSDFAFYAGAAMLMFALSLGPEPSAFGVPFWYKPPYAWLIELPGYAAARVPARFAMLGVLCLAVAAALAFARVVVSAPRRVSMAATCVVFMGVVADVWMGAIPLPAVPERLAWLESMAGGGPVVELPIGSAMRDTAALYRSMYHRRPIVNGYAGFVPPHYAILSAALDAGDDAAIEGMSSASPLTIVVDDLHGGERWARAAANRGRPVLAIGGRRLFVVPPSGRAIRASTGRPLPIQSAIANGSSLDIHAITDGDLLTRWDSGAPQRGTETVIVSLETRSTVDRVTLSCGPYIGEFPRALAIDIADAGGEWKPVWMGPAGATAVEGALSDPRAVPLRFVFEPVIARSIRLRQTGSDPQFHWAIAELGVFGR